MEVPREFKEKYLQRRHSDLEGCLRSLRDGDYLEIERIGHRMKGNAQTFGLPGLGAIGRNLETAAARADLAMLEEALAEFSQWLQHPH